MGDDSDQYKEVLDRFQSLEISHIKLKEQFKSVMQEKKKKIIINNNYCNGDMMTSFPGANYNFVGSPYRSVLECMGHAVYVIRAASAEFIFWNRAAEKLFGYKDYEILGRRVVELLIDGENQPSSAGFLERLNTVESWSGQLPLKKRNGQIFMAIVTKSPLYENGELVGIVTVAHDAAIFNSTSSGNTNTRQDHANEQPKGLGINLKKIQWRPQPQIAGVPHLASSVSNLASKVLSRKRGDVTCNMCRTARESEEADSRDAKADRPPRASTQKLTFNLSFGKSRSDGMSSEREEPTSEFSQPSKIAAKVLSKLQIGATANKQKTMDETIQCNGSENSSTSNEGACERCYRTESSSSYTCNLDTRNDPGAYQGLGVSSTSSGDYFPSSSFQLDEKPNMKSVDVDDASPGRSDSHKFLGSGESTRSSLSRGDNDSQVIVDRPIHRIR